jgi:hypothetical protein
MRPLPYAGVDTEPETNTLTSQIRAYKCDNRDYPSSRRALVAVANEQVKIEEHVNLGDKNKINSNSMSKREIQKSMTTNHSLILPICK